MWCWWSSGSVGYIRNVELEVEWLCRVIHKECGVGGRVAVGYIRNVVLVVEWLCRVHKECGVGGRVAV